MKGVFLDYSTIEPKGLDYTPLKQTLRDWRFFEYTPKNQITQNLHQVEIAVVNKTVLSAEILAAAPTLKFICVAATGTDHVDLQAAKDFGITVSNARNYATPTVVQHTIGLMLSLVTRLQDYNEAVKRGEWVKATRFCLSLFETHEIAGKNLGIIGFGQTGKAVAKVGEALGMKVLVAERKGTPPSKIRPGRLAFEKVLETSDVISLHCPLTHETKNLIDEAELNLMKNSAYLINVARGGIIQEDALANALRNGHIKGAGLDVLGAEPPTSSNPLVSQKIENLLVTPHVAWNTVEARQRLINEITENVKAFVKGAPRNVVTI